MSTEQLLRTVQYMEPLSLVRGDALVQQGEANARHFYIVYSGGTEARGKALHHARGRRSVRPPRASPGSGRSDAPRSAASAARKRAAACVARLSWRPR